MNPIPLYPEMPIEPEAPAFQLPNLAGLEEDQPREIPCSQSQKRFWFETTRDPKNPGINVAVRWRLEGDVVHAHVEEAWRIIIARHEMLRAAFLTIDGEPHQIIEPQVPFHVPLIDLTEMSSEAAAAEAERLASIEARTVFEIAQAPLIRVTLVRLQPDVSMILVTLHHAVCDGWSVGILAAEMGEICAALAEGRQPALPQLLRSYADYAAREQEWLAAYGASQRSELAERWQGFEQFEIAPDMTRPPVQTSNGEITSYLLDRDVTNGIDELARKKRCTMFTVAYASLLALLHRYSGATDITIGTPFSGREEVEFEPLVGTFVNTIALRTEVAGDITFDELIERARDTVTDAYELRYLPFEEMIEVANPKRDLSRNTLVSVSFTFQRSFIKNETYGGFRLIDLPSRSAGPICDLTFFMVERPEGWRLSCEFNTDLYREVTVKRLLQRWTRVMRAVGRDSSRLVSALPLMSEDERQGILAFGFGPATAYESDESVHDVFSARVNEAPGAVAVIDGTTELTYGQLDRRSNQLAHYLRSAGVGPESRIAVALERSVLVPIAFLAILKAGGSYVPLDPSYPRDRLSFMAEDANVSLVVTDGISGERLARDLKVIDLSAAAAEIAAQSEAGLQVPSNPGAAAYVMYTSGSTGRPKGVVVTHRGIVRLVRGTNYVEIGADDTVFQYGALTFDASTFEIWGPLLNGGRLAIAPPGPLSVAELRDTLSRFGVTTLWLTAAVFREVVEEELAVFAGLRNVLVGGDVVSSVHAKRVIDAFPRCRFVNGYGPTENTTFSCCYVVPSSNAIADSVPIGQPIANSSAFVLDAQLQPVPFDAVGELCVGGDGLALGYVNLPDLTAERFVSDPFPGGPSRLYRTGDRARLRDTGIIEFLGRFDDQIKIRGFRIEPHEIEAALLRCPEVRDAAVVVGTEASGDKAIWAYVVPAGSGLQAYDERALRGWLRDHLPTFMLPSRIAVLEALPLTSHGKVDRSALPVPEKKSSVARYHGATEDGLGEILSNLLDTDHVDRDVDIFDLGFHSLLAMRFTARVKEVFDVELPLRAFFENTTLASLAAYVDEFSDHTKQMAPVPIVALNKNGSRPPFILFHGDLFAGGYYVRKLAAALGPDQPLYAIAPYGTSGLPLVPSVEEMARDYVGLIRAVQPNGPYRLGGYCASGLVAYELARILQAEGESVDRLVLLNSSPMPSRRIALFDWLIRKVGLDRRISPRLRDRFCYNVSRMHAAALMGPAATFTFMAKFLSTWISGRSQAIKGAAEPPPFEKRQGLSETENSFAHLVAVLTYHPKPLEGDVTLVWGEDEKSVLDGATADWAPLVKHLQVELTTGGHVTAVHERVDDLARLLKTVLGDDLNECQ